MKNELVDKEKVLQIYQEHVPKENDLLEWLQKMSTGSEMAKEKIAKTLAYIFGIKDETEAFLFLNYLQGHATSDECLTSTKKLAAYPVLQQIVTITRGTAQAISTSSSASEFLERISNPSLVNPDKLDVKLRAISFFDEHCIWDNFVFFIFTHPDIVKKFCADKEVAFQDLLKFLKVHFKGEEDEMDDIGEFEEDYKNNALDAGKVMTWFTRESIIYKALNKAFMLQNPVNLYQVRYLIQMLHTAFSQLTRQHTKDEKPRVLYRLGVVAQPDVIARLKEKAGVSKEPQGDIILNSYPTFTADEQVKNRLLQTLPLCNAVFVVHGLPASKFGSETFFNIDKYSIVNYESEYLFKIGTVFTIINVEEKSEFSKQVLYIHLNVSKDENRLIQYVDSFMQELKDLPTSLILFGALMHQKMRAEH